MPSGDKYYLDVQVRATHSLGTLGSGSLLISPEMQVKQSVLSGPTQLAQVSLQGLHSLNSVS